MILELALVRTADAARVITPTGSIGTVKRVSLADVAGLGFTFSALVHCPVEMIDSDIRLFLFDEKCTDHDKRDMDAWCCYVGHSETEHSYVATEHGAYWLFPIANDFMRRKGRHRLVLESYPDPETHNEDREVEFLVV